MSIRPDERISFVLSDLSREQQTRRRNPTEDFATRSAAAVVGACANTDVEANGPDDGCQKITHVDAKRDTPPKLKSKRAFCTTIVGLWVFCTSFIAITTLFQIANPKIFELSMNYL